MRVVYEQLQGNVHDLCSSYLVPEAIIPAVLKRVTEINI